MSVLSICGVDLPVTVDSLRLSLEDIGTKARNTRGHRILERRRSKWSFEFTLSPKPLDEVLLYRSLILGDGEFWSTASSLYGSKGYALTGTGVWFSGNNPFGTGGAFELNGAETMIVPWKFADQSAVGGLSSGIQGGTLAGWRYDAEAATWRLFGWSWRASSSSLLVARQRVGALGSSGTVQAYSGGESFSNNGSTLTVTAEPAGSWYFSNLLLLPVCLPQTQVDQLLAGLATVMSRLPMLPRVQVMSDLFSTGQLSAPPYTGTKATLICHGEVSELEVMPLMRGGAFSSTDAALTGTLIEV